MLDQAGVDTSDYKGHSFRGAASSDMSRKGFSLVQILERANWTSAKTFDKFYKR